MKRSALKIGMQVFIKARYHKDPIDTPKDTFYLTIKDIPKEGNIVCEQDNDGFRTMNEARKFIKEFRERFRQQGYYRDNKWNKVPIEMIDLEIIPFDFNPFKTR